MKGAILTRRGFIATNLALSALIIMGILLSILATLFALEANRTKALQQTAQETQLLLAGQTLAAEALTHPINPPFTLQPPLPAATGELTITLTSLTPTTATFLITAHTADHTATQRLAYQKKPAGWILTTAMLAYVNATGTKD